MANNVIKIDRAMIERDERNRPSLAWTQLEDSKQLLRHQGIVREHLKFMAALSRAEMVKFVAQLAAELQP